MNDYYAHHPLPAPDETTDAFWNACHDRLTGLDAADRGGAAELAAWLRSRGAQSAAR